MERQVGVLLSHGRSDGGTVDLVDNLQDLGNVDRLDKSARTAARRSVQRFEKSLLPSFEFGKLDGASANVEGFPDVAGQGRDFGGQEGDGGRSDDGLLFVGVELMQAGRDDLADLVAGVSREIDFGGSDASSELKRKETNIILLLLFKRLSFNGTSALLLYLTNIN